jgi:hypothetical protein
MKISKGRQIGPRKILLYGEEGVGKSTFANAAPRTIFLDIEEGLRDIDCEKSDPLGTVSDVINAISWLANTPHDYKTVAIDTLDWLEKLIHKEVASAAGKPTIGEIAFGRGYELATKKWDFLLGGLSALHKKGMSVLLLAHSRIVKVDEPGLPRYERLEPDLHSSSGPMIREWCQDVLCARVRTFTRAEDVGFSRERTIASGGKDRYIQTAKTAGAVAKNRVDGMPEEIPMSWATYSQYVSAAYAKAPLIEVKEQVELPPAGDIEGVVVNGSSKVGVA